MLTINQIDKVLKKGVKLSLENTANQLGYKGIYEPGLQKITIYNKAISSLYDFDITLLHEFVHARDDILYSYVFFTDKQGRVSDISDVIEYEQATESEAILTYNHNSDVLDYIKEFYKIE